MNLHKAGTVVTFSQNCISGVVIGSAKILGTIDRGWCYTAELISSNNENCSSLGLLLK